MGHDCAYSIALPDGRAIWLFGDTYMQDRESKQPEKRTFKGMIFNCMAVVPKQDVSSGIRQFEYATDASGRAKQVIEFLPGEPRKLRRLWPMHGIAIPEGSAGGCRIVIYYTMVDVTDDLPPPGNITHLGSGIAVAHVASAGAAIGHFDRITSGGEPILWTPDEPLPGSAVMRDHADPYIIWVYAMLPGKKHDVGLAHTTEDRITTVSGLQYYTGDAADSYSPDFKRAKPMFDGVPTEMSVGWCEPLGKYLAIHTLLIFPETWARTADSATGPWTAGESIFKAKPITGKAKTFYYAAKEHVELATDGGRVRYLTYVDSEEYWPHLLEMNGK
jgi:hypothetical protein